MVKNLLKNKFEVCLVALLLVVAGVSHGYNMFNFPYYENDEGTYMAQAWSVSEHGEMAPYTYWYDHAPAGWFLLAGWAELTGGYFTFDEAVASGRILMLVLHIASALMLYIIARKLTGSIIAGAVTVLFFSLSPLAIYYQRRVLLDNIMVFWSLLSVVILLVPKLKFRHVSLSAIFFSIAVLSKENAVFFFPGIFYAIFIYAHRTHRLFVLIKWLAISGCLVSLYFFYALLKGELLPPGPDEERVSLLGTLLFHSGRGSDLPFWAQGSDFYGSFMTWMGKDPYIVVAGITASLIIVFTSLKNKHMWTVILLSVMSWLFLLRGGLVIDFYIASLVPFMAISLGVVIDQFSNVMSKKNKVVKPLIAGVLSLAILIPSATATSKQYLVNESGPQLAAVDWIRENIEPEDKMIIDMSIYLELRNPAEGPVFEDSDWFWKAQFDPEIRWGKYDNDWRNVDYFILSHEMVKAMKGGSFDFLEGVFVNSEYITGWQSDESETYINLDERISTNGDWMSIYEVKDPYIGVLERSWDFYKNNFIISYGQVIDPWQNDQTTSEGQSYAMLRAVYENDRDTFDGVYSWTKDNLGYRGDSLFSWLWKKDENGEYYKPENETASDAHADIVLALLFAHKQWGDKSYKDAALAMLDDMWEKEVVRVNGQNYFAPNTNAMRGDMALLNPSYFSPAHFKVFAAADPQHDWNSVVDSSYDLLERLAGPDGTNLPPNWVMVSQNGEISSAAPFAGDGADEYGFDAFRTMWRVALDAVWYDDPRAISYLENHEAFFLQQWKADSLVSVYNNGIPVTDGGTLSTNVGALAVFGQTETGGYADEFYAAHYGNEYNEEGFWGEKTNYFGQNWAWLGTALYSRNMPNLWWEADE